MNILFLTLGKIDSLESHTIYCDLLREFIKEGHSVSTLSPGKKKQEIIVYGGVECSLAYVDLDTVRGGKNLIKKGFSTIRTGSLFINGINQYYCNVRFDLVIYSTPPITFVSAVNYVRKRDGAKTYLLLKDIFPQNAVDIGIMSKSGIKGFLYKYFRRQEKKLYRISDRIGCMSQANVDYVINHNPEVDPKIVEVCPNSVEVIDKSVDDETRKAIREKHEIPQDKEIFVYGGNLGKPQGIPFLIECLKKCQDIENAYFLIVGDGTEYGVLECYVEEDKPANVKLMKRLPKEDYDTMVGACDVGLIFLDHRFSIPNFPSRLLAYMQAKIPVLAVTDPNTDIGKVIVDGGFGWWCESNDSDSFRDLIEKICKSDLNSMKNVEFKYLQEKYSVEEAYKTIVNQLEESK